MNADSNLNPYAAPEATKLPNRNSKDPGRPTRIRIVPLLFFVFNGVMLGLFAMPRSVFPVSLHPLRDYRNAGVGALMGLLIFVLVEFFYPKDE